MNPYLTIWISPIRTFSNEKIQNTSHTLPFLLYGSIFGLNISTAFTDYLGEVRLLYLPIALLIGIVMTFFLFKAILPALTRLVGLIWRGKGSTEQISNVYSLALIPYVIILLFQVVLMIVGLDYTVDSVNPVVRSIISLWSISLLIIGLSKIQGFSYGFAILNLLLAYLPFLVLILYLFV